MKQAETYTPVEYEDQKILKCDGSRRGKSGRFPSKARVLPPVDPLYLGPIQVSRPPVISGFETAMIEVRTSYNQINRSAAEQFFGSFAQTYAKYGIEYSDDGVSPCLWYNMSYYIRPNGHFGFLLQASGNVCGIAKLLCDSDDQCAVYVRLVAAIPLGTPSMRRITCGPTRAN